MEGGGRKSLEKAREEKKWKEKERKRKGFKIIQLILFHLVQNLTSPERCQKITENREYYPET